MSGGKESPKMEVVDYYLAVHFGLCHGPIDAITRIIVKEKLAWEGRAGHGQIAINKRDLFGGNKKEGGVAGTVEVLTGKLDQVIPEYMASRFRRTSATMPAYRGIASLYFSDGSKQSHKFSGRTGGGKLGRGATLPSTGTPNTPGGSLPLTGDESYGPGDLVLDDGGGFFWASNNPYLPDTWVTVERLPMAPLSGGTRAIPNLVPIATVLKDEDGDGQEDGDDDEDQYPDYFFNDPQNDYYIGALPDAETAAKERYGKNATPDKFLTDPFAYIQNLSEAQQAQSAYKQIVHRNYGNDGNPAHQIMEAMMNTEWGMGAPETMFDGPAWEHAAQILFEEGFGLSMLWVQQAKVEDWIAEIIDHIQAVIYVDPRTGKFVLKLIRDDYKVSDLPIITPQNARLKSYGRKLWGETVNEMTVTWTNPENEGESTVTLHDLGNIGQQGGIVSDTRNYYGVRKQSLARRLCARDLRTASAPLMSAEVELLRTFWDITPGAVVRVQWPEDGFGDIVMRVMDVDYGKVGGSTIRCKLMEDVFSLETQEYTPAAPDMPTLVVSRPDPLDFIDGFTIPSQLLRIYAAGSSLTDSSYPQVRVMLLGASETYAVEGFEIVVDRANGTGSMEPNSIGAVRVTTHGLLPEGLPKELESNVVAISGQTRQAGVPTVGGLAILGDSDENSEIVMFLSWSETTGYRIARGMLDTVPRAWGPDTSIWILDPAAFNALDPYDRTAGVEQDYLLLSRTAEEMADEDDGVAFTFEPTARPYMPTRPANCRLGGQRLKATFTTRPATVLAQWANRNRAMEDTVFPRWTDGSVTPEQGQTTVLEVIDALGGVEATHEVATGLTEFSIPTDGLSGGQMAVRFRSKRGEFLSLQGYTVGLEIPADAGYGSLYGLVYGE